MQIPHSITGFQVPPKLDRIRKKKISTVCMFKCVVSILYRITSDSNDVDVDLGRIFDLDNGIVDDFRLLHELRNRTDHL